MRRFASLLVFGALLLAPKPSLFQNIDTVQPIVKISPARRVGSTDDMFGFSAVAHQTAEVADNDTYLAALEKTLIMVGAPKGRFPGGLSGIEPSGLACRGRYPGYNDSQLENLSNVTQCYEDLRMGLVYSCPLSSEGCGATLGNNISTAPDGLLFDRVGNTLRYFSATELCQDQDKDGQLMGATMFSRRGYFVACAPLWEYTAKTNDETQRQGQCVYSKRNLTGFAILQPCLDSSSSNLNGEGFCLFGSSIHISDNGSNPLLAAGVPGRNYGSGGSFYYNDLDNFTVDENNKKNEFVPASHDGSMFASRPGFHNVDGSETSTYYGFSITSGYITSKDTTDFVISAPRWNKNSQLGRVFIIKQLNEIPNTFVEGEQFGEYFGNSITVADLNGDGWDDLVVGAPMYSKPTIPEIGRVFIFQNNNGVLNKSVIIEGFKKFSRFGYSVDVIGDINNDGYQDIAISAPYEGSGVVYIYHGQEMDSSGSIIDTSYKQRIDGAALTERVSNLSEVNMFGFSLSGSVDVDNNQYNDLVVGAHESQAVFVLCSRPIASVDINIFFSGQSVSLISFQCIDSTSRGPVSCFSIEVCAIFSGKSLDNGFSTNYTLREDIVDTQRLFFDSYADTSITRLLEFNSPNKTVCDTVTVYILNSTLELDYQDFQLVAEVQQVTRPGVLSNSDLVPQDLSVYPLIESEAVSYTVPVDSQCGSDEVCDLDLSISYINITYLGLNGEPYSEDQTQLTLDVVDRVVVYLSVKNTGEDTFGFSISYPLPREIFLYISSPLNCNDKTPDNSSHANLVCSDRQIFFRESDGTRIVGLRWRVNSSFRGGVEGVFIPVSIAPDSNDSRNRENNTNNNQLGFNIAFTSRVSYQTSLLFGSEQVTYLGDHTPTVNDDASNLGELLRLTVTINNKGPSTIQNGVLNLYIPARLQEETGDYYFYYPATLQVTNEDSLFCRNNQTVLNPERFRNAKAISNRRRRRFVRGEHSLVSTLYRSIRQDSIQSYNLDCQRTSEQCISLECDVVDLPRGSVSLDIIGYIDERFYYRKTDIYRLRAYAEMSVLDSFTNTNGSNASSYADLLLTKYLVINNRRIIEWYYIAPPIVGGVLIIIALSIALYCIGFFRRKRHKRMVAEEENVVQEDNNIDDKVEQFVPDPFGDHSPPNVNQAVGTPFEDDLGPIVDQTIGLTIGGDNRANADHLQSNADQETGISISDGEPVIDQIPSFLSGDEGLNVDLETEI